MGKIDYSRKAKEIRKTVLRMIYEAQTSHIGSNFSAVDILVVLFSLMGKNDHFILSKSWAAATVYALLADRGDFPKELLDTYCKPQSELIGLISHKVPGVEFGAGAMGHGLPVACGMALAKKMKKEEGKVFVLMSDGEMDCGTTWECALFASHHKLNNLIVIVDFNKWQATGRTKEVLNIEPLKDKWISFNWVVTEINGHNFEQIKYALFGEIEKFRDLFSSPEVIIAHTVKGSGGDTACEIFEDKLEWHYKAPNKDEYAKALQELE